MSFIVPSRHLGLLLLHPIGNGLSSRISHKIVDSHAMAPLLPSWLFLGFSTIIPVHLAASRPTIRSCRHAALL